MKTLSPDKIKITIPSNYGKCSHPHWLSNSVLEHKVYPTCRKCKEKYVPIVKGDKMCFRCKARLTVR